MRSLKESSYSAHKDGTEKEHINDDDIDDLAMAVVKKKKSKKGKKSKK